MTVKNVGKGKWRVQVEVGTKWDGSRDRRTATFPTKRDAEAQEEAWLSEKKRFQGLRSRMTFGAYVDKVWWPSKVNTLEQTSLDSYEQDLRLRLRPAFEDAELDKIDRLAVQQMINGCGSYSTAKRARDLLRAIYNSAMDYGVAASNPAAGRFQYPRKAVRSLDDEDEGAWLTTFEEHRGMLDAARGQGEIEKIMILGLCFGLRKEEILGLDVRNLDFKARVIHVRHAYVPTSQGNMRKRTKTPESERDLPMTDYAFDRLQALTEGLEPSSPVCLARTSKRLSPSTATKMVRRFVDRNGLPRVTMKTLRHSFASACIDAGVDIAKVSAWLGHTNITTTLDRYVKTRKKDLGAVPAIMDKIIGGR